MVAKSKAGQPLNTFVEGAKQLFWSSRPISWVNTAFPFALAYLIVADRIDAVLIVGTLFFLIPYNLLMYGINDVFDYESDLRNPRKGGIEGAVLDKRWHRLTVWASLLGCLPFIAFLIPATVIQTGSWQTAGWLALAVFTVVAYSAKGFRFKEIPFLDSITSTSHFVLPAMVGLSAADACFCSFDLQLILWAFLLWGVASHAFGAVQDVRADREAGIASIATKLGARATSRFAFACYAVAGALTFGISWPGPLAAIAVLPYLVIVAPFLDLADEDCERANRGWRKFIWLNFFAGFVATMLLIS